MAGRRNYLLFSGIVRKGLSDEVWGGELGRREERARIEPHVYEEARCAQNRPGLGMSGTEENITAMVGDGAGQAAKTRSIGTLLP